MTEPSGLTAKEKELEEILDKCRALDIRPDQKAVNAFDDYRTLGFQEKHLDKLIECVKALLPAEGE